MLRLLLSLWTTSLSSQVAQSSVVPLQIQALEGVSKLRHLKPHCTKSRVLTYPVRETLSIRFTEIKPES